MAVMVVLLLNISNPGAGGALLGLIPLAVIGIAGIAVLFLFIPFAFRTSPPSGSGTEILDDLERPIRLSGSGGSAFPKVQADLERERIFSLEDKFDRRGGSNPDGGIDIVVHSGTERFAVQCKFWKAYEVGVRQVREFLGALQDAQLSEGVIVSIKGFTDPARELAARHKIEFIGKSNLLGMLKDVRYTPHIREINAIMDIDDKHCPKCERQMLLRTSSKDGSKFWGCSGFPRCRFTLKIAQ